MCNMWKERISEGEWTSGRDFQCVSTFVPFCPTSKHSLSLKSVAATFCERCMDCQEVSLISSQFGQRFNEYVRVVASVSACQEWISKHQCASIASMTQQDYCSSFAEYWIVLYWIVLKHIETHWNTLKQPKMQLLRAALQFVGLIWSILPRWALGLRMLPESETMEASSVGCLAYLGLYQLESTRI